MSNVFAGVRSPTRSFFDSLELSTRVLALIFVTITAVLAHGANAQELPQSPALLGGRSAGTARIESSGR